MLRLMIVLCVICLPAGAFAHGIPDLCTADGDLEMECGADHTCDFRAEVSDQIGVCQSDVEGTTFETCRFTEGDVDCPDGFVCRIGQVSTQIGACIEDESAAPEPQAPDESDDDESCSAVAASPTWFALLILGVFIRRRR